MSDDMKKRARRNVLVFSKSSDPEKNFFIDEDDYIVVKTWLSWYTWWSNGDNYEIIRLTQKVVTVKKDGGEFRVDKIDSTYLGICRSLPEDFGALTSLSEFNLHGSQITSLPPSIGRLHNLKDLDLSWTCELSNLPEEIGNLKRLKKLNLYGSKIECLPPSIGKLQSLKEINLGSTVNLQELPTEIGDLSILEKLYFSSSKIKSLPPSIGKLQSLKEIDLTGSFIECLPPSIGKLQSLKEINLGSTKKLQELPTEIGDLSILEKLYLYRSKIKSLPPSIGKLRSLEDLNLSWTCELSNLPEEIWNLTRLKKLNLSCSNIKSLPPSIDKFQNLKELDVQRNSIAVPHEIENLANLTELKLEKSAALFSSTESLGRLKRLKILSISESFIVDDDDLIFSEEECELLLKLTRQCRYLGYLGPQKWEYASYAKEILLTLACNRARSRTGFGMTEQESNYQMQPALWPSVLSKAQKSFEPYYATTARRTRDHCWYSGPISEPDAIFQLIFLGWGSFLEVLQFYRNATE